MRRRQGPGHHLHRPCGRGAPPGRGVGPLSREATRGPKEAPHGRQGKRPPFCSAAQSTRLRGGGRDASWMRCKHCFVWIPVFWGVGCSGVVPPAYSNTPPPLTGPPACQPGILFENLEFCELRGAWGGGALQDIDSKETPLYIHTPATPRATASAPPQQNRRGDSLPVTVHTEVTRNNRPLARMHPHNLPHPASTTHPPNRTHPKHVKWHGVIRKVTRRRPSAAPSTHPPIHPSTIPTLGLNEVGQRDTCGVQPNPGYS